MAAMFSNVRSSSSSTGHIVEFKAGRSNLEAGSSDNLRKVVADPKKGLVYIKQSNDMLTHFCWKDRETGAVIDDLIIFPDDAEFKAVNGCPDGKVYMLKFKSSKDMRIYWLQDGNPDADKDLVKKVNEALNKPPSARPSNRGNVSERLNAGGFPPNEDYGGALGGLDQNQLLSLIQSLQGNNSDTLSLPPAAAAAAAAAANTSALPSSEADCEPAVDSASNAPANLGITSADLSQILSNLRPGTSSQKQVEVSLSNALCSETVSETAKSNADKLKPLLPESSNPDKELVETVRAPQFRQAVDTFGHALQTGQIGPVLSQFGIDEATVQAASQGDLEGFAKNLTIAEGGQVPEEDKDESTKEPEAKRNRPDLEDMDVD